MEFVTKVVECVNTFLWDYALLILLLGAGIIYSFSLKFIQIRKFGAGMKAFFAAWRERRKWSQFFSGSDNSDCRPGRNR